MNLTKFLTINDQCQEHGVVCHYGALIGDMYIGFYATVTVAVFSCNGVRDWKGN